MVKTATVDGVPYRFFGDKITHLPKGAAGWKTFKKFKNDDEGDAFWGELCAQEESESEVEMSRAEAVEVLAPARRARPAQGGEMQAAAEGLRRDFDEFKRLAAATSLQMAKVGLRLMWVRENVPYGEWVTWLEENVPQISQRQAFYLLKTAEEIVHQAGIGDGQRDLLALGDPSRKGYKIAEQLLMDFVGEESPMELMRRLGVRKSRQLPVIDGPATADPTDTPEHIAAADAWSEIKRLLYHNVQCEHTYAHLRKEELEDAYQLLKDSAAAVRRSMS